MKTIVLGYDGTEPAKRALERTAELAKAFDATVLVTSVAPVLIGTGGHGMGVLDPADPAEAHEEELKDAANFLGKQHVRAECSLGIGDPAKAIVELATDRHADLIVVGTRDAGFLGRLVDPSVSGAVQRRAHCDVLIVH